MNTLQTHEEHKVLKIPQKKSTLVHLWTLVFATLIQWSQIKFLLMLVWNICVTYLEFMEKDTTRKVKLHVPRRTRHPAPYYSKWKGHGGDFSGKVI